VSDKNIDVSHVGSPWLKNMGAVTHRRGLCVCLCQEQSWGDKIESL